MSIVEAWRRETVYCKADIRANPFPDNFRLQRYRIRYVTTLQSSWGSSECRQYGDALEPVSTDDELADITAIHVSSAAKPGPYQFSTETNESLQIKVLNQDLPEEKVFPFYAEVNSHDCLVAYHTRGGVDKQPDRADEKQGEITRHAIDLARSFGIEPVKQALNWFDNPHADREQVEEKMKMPYGYEDLVLKGAIAPPIIWCGSIYQDRCYEPNHHFLKRINELAPKNSMAWCADEPTYGGFGTGMSVHAAIERIKLVKTYAPSLIPLITTGTKVLPTLQKLALENDLSIRYCIVQNEDAPDLLSNQKGSYFSCMAQGCGPASADKQRTNFPVAVLEGDKDKDFHGAIKLAHANNALFALYYKITKRLATCWLEGGLWNEGGNGDGTAMYIDLKTGLAIPSVRMMYWHQAQQVVEKNIQLSRGG